MAGILTNALGGLIQGLGQGAVDEWKSMREEKLQQLRADQQSALNRQDHKYRMIEGGRADEADLTRGQALAEQNHGYAMDEIGARGGIDAANAAADDERGRAAAAEDDARGHDYAMGEIGARGEQDRKTLMTRDEVDRIAGGLTEADKRLIDSLKGEFEGGLAGEFDGAGLAERLHTLGRDDLARNFGWTGEASGGVTLADARATAAQEAEDQSLGLIGRIADDEPWAELAGGKDAWIEQRAQEIYKGSGDGASADAGGADLSPAQGSAGGVAPTNPASGSAAAAPPVPPPAERVEGQTYTAPDGRKVIWRGTGWEISG